MYDAYRHLTRPELRLLVRRGAELPPKASKASWRSVGRELKISQIEANEIERNGFSISRPRGHLPE